jgi:DNA-binding XRE family transcriptional regulator
MKMSDLIPFEVVLEEQLRDPEFRAEWERTAPARALANRLIGYRIEHGLTLVALARLLGISRDEMVLLEAGDELPPPEIERRATAVLDSPADQASP